MIAQLKGTIERKELESVLVDVNGVGYRVRCSEATVAQLPLGKQVVLRVHTHVREDAIELFGFASELEEILFHELNRVPGVGPRSAMAILGGGTPEEIAAAIVRGDLARLRKLPGVGKKTAERLVVNLRERLASWAAGVPQAAGARRGEAEAAPAAQDELLLALAALGYKPAEAERLAALARSRAPEAASLEELVREALRAR